MIWFGCLDHTVLQCSYTILQDCGLYWDWDLGSTSLLPRRCWAYLHHFQISFWMHVSSHAILSFTFLIE